MPRFQPIYGATRICTAALLLCVGGLTAVHARQSAIDVVAVDGKTQTIDLARLPRAHAEVSEDGTPVSYEGVLLGDILAAAGVPRGSLLRGPALSQFVVVEARDGYRVVFTLAELDKGFSDTTVLLADRRGGKAIDADLGPLRMVVPKEQRHGRWIRQVQRISIREAR